MIKITVKYSGTDPAFMESDGENLKITIDAIEVFSQDVTEYETAGDFLDALNDVAGIVAETDGVLLRGIESIYIGKWDLSSDVELGVILAYVSILSEKALMNWEQAKSYLGATEDEREYIESLINSVSEAAERYYAKRPLKAREIEKIVDGNNSNTMILETYPVSDAQAFVDGTRNFPESSEITVLTYADEGKILIPTGRFPSGYQNIKLVYTAGYDPVPQDLVLACAESVAYQRTRLQQNGVGIKSMSSPNGITTSYELTFPMNAQRVFESYRDMRV